MAIRIGSGATRRQVSGDERGRDGFHHNRRHLPARSSVAPTTVPSSRMACNPEMSRSIPALSGRALTGLRACWSRSPPPTASKISKATTFVDALPESDYTAKLLIENLPAAQDIFYRVRFQDLASPTIVGEPQVGRFRTAPNDRRSISFVWSGDTAGQGWGIDESRGGMRAYATMLKNRPDFFIHNGDNIYADGPIAAEQKMPNGEVWRNIVTEDKSKPAETLVEFRGNYKYNLLDKNVRAFATPRCRYSPNGTITRSPTTGGPASR